MARLMISNDIIPVGEFKSSISKYLRNIQNTDHPIIITQNGKPAGVLLSPHEYDSLIHKQEFVNSVSQGLQDIEDGKSHTTEDLRSMLASRRNRGESS